MDELTQEQINEVIVGLGLTGTHDNDIYIARYHIQYPNLVGSKNYLAKLEGRKAPARTNDGWASSAFAFEEKKEVRPKHKPPSIVEFRERCDTMLCDLENGNWNPLIGIKKRHADTIRNIIMYGSVGGGDPYYESMDDMKSVSPEHYKIWGKLISMFPPVAKTKNLVALIEKLGLHGEIDGINITTKPERLYDNDYTNFVFYNVVSNKVIMVKCADVESRWKGKKTMVGEIKRFAFSRDLVPKLVKCTTGKGVLRLNIRKIYEEDKIKITPNMALVKTFKI